MRLSDITIINLHDWEMSFVSVSGAFHLNLRVHGSDRLSHAKARKAPRVSIGRRYIGFASSRFFARDSIAWTIWDETVH